jgi:cytochrome b
MTDTAATKKIRVWDPIVRIGHWVLVVGFFTAYFTGDEFFQQHLWAGYAVAATVAIRIVWGVIGPKHARFSSFVRSPAVVFAYVSDLVKGRGKRHVGHNPAGGAMIVALLISLAGTAGTGMALYAVEDNKGPLAGIFTAAPQQAEPAYTGARGDEDDEEEAGEHAGGEDIWEGLHSVFVYLTLGLVALHVGGVVFSSLAHKENLVRAMVTGRKRPE